MVDGTTLEVDDLVRKIAIPRERSHSIAVAAGIMQMLILRGIKEIPCNEKRRNLVKFFFSETMLRKYSPFSDTSDQNRSTPPLEQFGISSITPTSTESAISQPLALPSPSEPSRSSATASLNRHHQINFRNMRFLARLLGREHWKNYKNGALQSLKDFGAKFCFMFDVIELASKD